MSRPGQALLIDEPPIGVSPKALWVFGPGAAIFLQQLHYFLHLKRQDPERYRDSFIDGRFWVHWSMQELLQRVPIGRSNDPHKRVIAMLQSIGVLEVRQHRAQAWNHTNHYAINYDELDAYVAKALADRPIGGKATHRSVANPPPVQSKDHTSIGGNATDHWTETSPKTSTDTPPDDARNADAAPAAPVVGVVLSKEAEVYRPAMVTAAEGLPQQLQQQIADELSDRASRVAHHGAPQIGDVAAWLGALRRKALAGEFQPSGGLRVGQALATRRARASAQRGQDPAREVEQAAQARKRAAIQAFLNALSDDDLVRLANAARDCACIGRGTAVHTLVMARKVPERLEAVALRKAITALGWTVEIEP